MVWSQAYIAFCIRCRNFAVQSDCRTLNYIILTSSGRLRYLPEFVVVTKIQKRSLRSSQNLEEAGTGLHTTWSLNSKQHHMINAFLPYKAQYWLATRLAKSCTLTSCCFVASLFEMKFAHELVVVCVSTLYGWATVLNITVSSCSDRDHQLSIANSISRQAYFDSTSSCLR